MKNKKLILINSLLLSFGACANCKEIKNNDSSLISTQQITNEKINNSPSKIKTIIKKVGVALGIWTLIKLTDELTCWGLAGNSLSHFKEVKNASYEEKVNAFLSAAKKAAMKLQYSGKAAIIYTIFDILMLKNASAVQRASVARLCATNYGVCRTIAMMFAYWMNHLGIENHLILKFHEDNVIGSAHLYNCYKSKGKWYYVDGLDGKYFESVEIGEEPPKSGKNYIIEPTNNLSFIKFQLGLRVIPYEDFFKNGNRDFEKSNLKIKDLIPMKTLVHLY